MKSVSAFVKILMLVVLLVAIGTFVLANYSWVFSKRVVGEVVDVERVTDPTAIYGAHATEAQMYSYSILIRGNDGHLYTSSSEDRQWQVIKRGYCVEALLYRYPPWHLEQAGNFYNARLKDVKVCPGQSALPTPMPVPTPLPAPAPRPPNPPPAPAEGP